MTPKKSSPVPPLKVRDSEPSPIELEVYLKAYLSNKSRTPPRSTKSRIMPYIAALRVEAAAIKDYKTASRLSQAEQDLRAYFQTEMHHDRAVRAVQTPATPSAGLSLRLESATRRFEHEIAEFTRQRRDLIQQLRLAHEFERTEFHRHWSDPESLKAYTKASPQLLQLREIERRKVLILDYDGAEEVRQVADRLEAHETAVAHEKVRQGVATALGHMEKRHRMELDAAERLTAKKLCHLRNERDAVVIPLERQLKKAEKREEMEPGVIRALSSRGRRCRSPRYEGDDVDLATPRTYTKIMRMRTATGVGRLPVEADPESSRRSASRRSHSAQRDRFRFQT
jgi:hypothetical protein